MNVIVVMSDSLRRDHLGCYGNDWIRTPHLDAFAKQSAVFQDAYISSHPTLPNRRDLFTGRWHFPWRGWGPLGDDPVLAEWLAEAGIVSMLVGDTYHMFKEGNYFHRGFTAWEWIRGQEGDQLVIDPNIPIEFPCDPKKIRQPYPDRYPNIVRNRYRRHVETDWSAPATMRTAMEWLERNYTRESFLLWVDCFDPHEPWDPPQHYVDLYDPNYDLPEDCDYPVNARCDFLSERELKHTRARYAGEVTMVDRWFGQLIETVQLTGLWDDTMIVFTADHGHYLNYPGDGGLIGKPLSHGGEHWPFHQSLARIPLLVRLPGAPTAGKRVRGIAQPPDVAPTILEALGLDVPDRCHGESFLPLLRGERQKRRRHAVYGAHRQLAQISNDRVSYSAWEARREPALYDLREDPLMERDLAAKDPVRAAKLHDRLLNFLAALDVPASKLAEYRAE